MKPNYNLCDKCGNKAYTPSIFLETGSHYDGVESVSNGTTVDLCEKCLRIALLMVVGTDWETVKRVIKWLESKPPRS